MIAIRAPRRAPRIDPAPPPADKPVMEVSGQLAQKPLPDSIADDVLEGVDEISRFLFGPDAKPGRARTAINRGLPCWKIGNRYMARRSTLIAWIAGQESSFESG